MAVTGNSLTRISALGADGGVCHFFLEGVFGRVVSPFLVYKTRVIFILQRLFISVVCFLVYLLVVGELGW